MHDFLNILQIFIILVYLLTYMVYWSIIQLYVYDFKIYLNTKVTYLNFIVYMHKVYKNMIPITNMVH